MDKRIGILTYFWSYNPGTFLQAYATLLAFRRALNDGTVELINIRHGRIHWRPHLIAATMESVIKDVSRFCKYRRSKRRYLVLSRPGVVTRNVQKACRLLNEGTYDLIIVGSDTVLEMPPKYLKHGDVPIYWLPTDVTSIKVMCASSARATSIADLTERQREILSERIREFSLLGVRDQATLDLLSDLGGPAISDRLTMVPDPTFAYDIDHSLATEYLQRAKVDFSRPIVGMHFTRHFRWADEVARLFRQRGCQIVSLRPAAYADFCVHDVCPLEWAGLFRNFRVMLTHRFHDTLFSLKNLVPVVSIVPDLTYNTGSGESKYRSLLRAFDMEEYSLITDHTMIDARSVLRKAEEAMTHFDRNRVARTMDTMRDEYLAFVKHVVGLLKA